MSSINKINVYTCDTCKRTVERLSDGNRPDPVRCVITNKCRGKLSLTGSRPGSQPKLTKPVLGLEDWIKRGTVLAESTQAPKTVRSSISSFGGNGGITLACVRFRDVSGVRYFYANGADGAEMLLESRPVSFKMPLNTLIKAVLYELTPEVLVYRHYTYTFSTAASVLEGQDDSAAQASLRFTSANIIKVYVNGVELDPTAYNRTVDNKITLTPKLLDNNLVIDVYVYNDIRTAFDESTAINLEFKALDVSTGLGLRNTTAWGDTLTIDDSIDQAVLFYCTDLGLLDKTKSYGVERIDAVSDTEAVKEVEPSDLTILLSSAPHSFNDKQLTRYLKGAELIGQGVLTFNQNETTGVFEPTVTEDLITKVFVPVKITAKLTNAELTNPLAQETTSLPQTVATPVAFILGPC